MENEMDNMVKVIIKRGLVAPDCHWWDESDKLPDKSGIKTFNKLLKLHNNKPFIPLRMLNVDGYLVTDIKFIEKILKNSPHIFGFGKLKYDFFKSFMKYNVGVSNCPRNKDPPTKNTPPTKLGDNIQMCPWSRRREVNDKVLYFDRKHAYGDLYDKQIGEIVNNISPTLRLGKIKFNDFVKISKKVATKIVFGEDKIADPIFDFLSAANSTKPFESGGLHISKELKTKYINYMKKYVRNPIEGSLVWLAVKKFNGLEILSEEELIHQIPHWVFPIAGGINSAFIRLLILLSNHPNKYKKAKSDKNYLRKCILETFRLNNNVVSLFRTLVSDFSFNSQWKFKKGTQFLILTNPILRSPQYYDDADKFMPERFSKKMERKYPPAISFSRGPQQCPGKELAIFVIQSFFKHFIKKYKNVTASNKVNKDNISHAINPCKIVIK